MNNHQSRREEDIFYPNPHDNLPQHNYRHSPPTIPSREMIEKAEILDILKSLTWQRLVIFSRRERISHFPFLSDCSLTSWRRCHADDELIFFCGEWWNGGHNGMVRRCRFLHFFPMNTHTVTVKFLNIMSEVYYFKLRLSGGNGERK